MIMNDMPKYLVRAAEELGLRITVAHVVTLSGGRPLHSEAYFPDLGNPRGTLVFRPTGDLDNSARQELKAQGYGISTFSEPLPSETFEIENYAEMFSEWGWSGEMNQRPSWMA
jgi:hypothetical protein